MTIEVGSSLFEDLTYFGLCLTLLIFGIAVVYGLFNHSAKKKGSPPPPIATPAAITIEAEMAGADLRIENRTCHSECSASRASLTSELAPASPATDHIALFERDGNRFAYNTKVSHCRFTCGRKRDPPRVLRRCYRCADVCQYLPTIYADKE